jgi:hypothetical protein
MSNDVMSWCEKIEARLPELKWSLSHWPKNHLKRIPEGLFQMRADWLPAHAFMELEHELSQLKALAEDSKFTEYLSQRIAKQIDVLVDLGQQNLGHFHELLYQPGLTRAQQVNRLQSKKDELLEQQQALQTAYQKTGHVEVFQELEYIKHHLIQIENLICRT